MNEFEHGSVNIIPELIFGLLDEIGYILLKVSVNFWVDIPFHLQWMNIFCSPTIRDLGVYILSFNITIFYS